MKDQSRRDALKLSAIVGAAALGSTLLETSAVLGQERRSETRYEEIDAQIEKHARRETPKLSRQDLSALPDSVSDTICGVYKPVRGIIVAISDFPLLKASWRTALKALIAVLDQICGT